MADQKPDETNLQKIEAHHEASHAIVHHPSKSKDYPAGRVDEREHISLLKSVERIVNTESALIDRYSVRGSIGVRMRKRRMELDFTQETLGKLLDVSRETISQYEIGKSRLDAADLPRLCVALDVPLVYFFQDIYLDRTFPNASPVPEKSSEKSSENNHEMSTLYDRLDAPARRVLVDVAMSLWQNQPARSEGREIGPKAPSAGDSDKSGGGENEEEASVAKTGEAVL